MHGSRQPVVSHLPSWISLIYQRMCAASSWNGGDGRSCKYISGTPAQVAMLFPLFEYVHVCEICHGFSFSFTVGDVAIFCKKKKKKRRKIVWGVVLSIAECSWMMFIKALAAAICCWSIKKHCRMTTNTSCSLLLSKIHQTRWPYQPGLMEIYSGSQLWLESFSHRISQTEEMKPLQFLISWNVLSLQDWAKLNQCCLRALQTALYYVKLDCRALYCCQVNGFDL